MHDTASSKTWTEGLKTETPTQCLPPPDCDRNSAQLRTRVVPQQIHQVLVFGLRSCPCVLFYMRFMFYVFVYCVYCVYVLCV
jgi:ABC-type nickel/cobalt efflux system permease component RcnA